MEKGFRFSSTSAEDVYIQTLLYCDLLNSIDDLEITGRGKSNIDLTNMTENVNEFERGCDNGSI